MRKDDSQIGHPYITGNAPLQHVRLVERGRRNGTNGSLTHTAISKGIIS
jgi:hypothetical protein